jgi:DNA-directed RNA polymerase subunit M/transcription elongation factor TFIIS
MATECAQCGAAIIAAVWAEQVSERCVRNVWSCDECGYEFETEVRFAVPSGLVRKTTSAKVDQAAPLAA